MFSSSICDYSSCATYSKQIIYCNTFILLRGFRQLGLMQLWFDPLNRGIYYQRIERVEINIQGKKKYCGLSLIQSQNGRPESVASQKRKCSINEAEETIFKRSLASPCTFMIYRKMRLVCDCRCYFMT